MSTVYSVGQINSYIKRMFSQDFLLKKISIKGEVSNCNYHGSGHIYFDLKDETGVISCILFFNDRKGLNFRMSDGQKVVVTGSVNVYERSGTYQLYAKEIKLDGLGELYARYEALKHELEEMGMFAEEYKQAIPHFIRTLGVVTAPTGAAVRDIINIAVRRNPGIRIILYPAKVQGAGAAESIAEGIRALDVPDVDTIIVGRGGGSIEDLWAFNEIEVANAIFQCSTPVISAVGHQTDTTIADYVADLRAPTPSAGAELAVDDMKQVFAVLEQYEDRMRAALADRISKKRELLLNYRKLLKSYSPQSRLQEAKRKLEVQENRLRSEMQGRLQAEKGRLAVSIERLRGLSPLNKLEAGYACVIREDGKRVFGTADVMPGDPLRLYLSDGYLDVTTRKVVPEQTASPAEIKTCGELQQKG